MRQWHRAVRLAGFAGRIVHDLRRSAIKRMVEIGIDQRTAMAFSGHKTVHTFHRYQIVDMQRMKQAAELLKRPPAREELGQEQGRVNSWRGRV